MKSKSNRHAYQSKACFTVRLFLLLLAAVLFAPAVSAQNNQRVDKSREGRIKAGICKVIGKVVDTGKNPAARSTYLRCRKHTANSDRCGW